MAFYSFVTSSLMNGRRDLLPLLIFSTVWANIESSIEDGQVRAIEIVRDELTRRDDAVSTWAKSVPALFLPLDSDVQRATRTMRANTARATPRNVRSGDPKEAMIVECGSG